MAELWEQISAWGPIAWVLQYEAVLWWLAILSGAVGIFTLVAAPWLVCWIPEDYFASRERPSLRGRSRHPAMRWTLRILKNLAGAVLVIMGLFLVPLPGQGMLVTLTGLLLLNFPGKRRMEMWAIRRPGLLNLINWLRVRRGRRPLRIWSPDALKALTVETPSDRQTSRPERPVPVARPTRSPREREPSGAVR